MAEKVLVTGAEGFIGSHLTEFLLDKGYQVRAFVWYNSFNQAGWIDTFSTEKKRQIEIIKGDIRDSFQVHKAVSGQDLVIHLAALIGIPYSYQAPESYVETNVKGTLNILQACREHACHKVLIASTSEVYGTARSLPISEDHPLQPQSPYSASKIAADSLALSFFHSFGLPVSLIRPFNTYGPRQSQRAIIPTVIGQLLRKQKALHLGDLRPKRDLCFVADTVAAIEAILTSSETVGKAINIATGSAHSMQEVVDTLVSQIQPHTPILQDPDRMRPANSEVQHLCGDASLLRSLTNWQPTYSLEKGLQETISWFRERPHLWGSGGYIT